MNPRTVLLYGRSMLLSLVAAGLAECTDLSVVRAATWPETELLVKASSPDVLIFDLAGADESHLLSLLLESPQLQLIGLDSESNRAVMLTGHQAQSLTLSQLRELAQREVP